VNRDSGTASANGGWLRRLVRHHRSHLLRDLNIISMIQAQIKHAAIGTPKSITNCLKEEISSDEL
jgi:hypothetical protein